MTLLMMVLTALYVALIANKLRLEQSARLSLVGLHIFVSTQLTV